MYKHLSALAKRDSERSQALQDMSSALLTLGQYENTVANQVLAQVSSF